jgi:pyrophosphatase ppaX
MINKNKVIIFDCDGTLVDTFALIEQTVLLTFQKMLPHYSLSLDEAHQFFGPFLNDSFRKYVKTEEEVNKLVACYRQINKELMETYISTYEGIPNLLKELKKRGYKLAVVSNKISDDVIQGLKICHIDIYFDCIIGVEKLKKAKPNPDGIYQVLNYFHTTDALMIGDTIIDIQTGQNAHVKTVGVTWCKTKKTTFIESGADYIANHPRDIIQIIEGINYD